MKYILTVILLSLATVSFSQQVLTAEDSLDKNLSTFLSHTTLGGYGNVIYQRDFNQDVSSVNLERFVLFIGHKFSNKITFFSELELEDAKIEGGEDGGELSLEQCYLKFSFNPSTYIVAGLFLPRIGILNENHLPNTFLGNERTQVETFVIPSTWRELGIGLYGSLNRLPVNYTIGIMNGLNSGGFEHGTGIRGGRFEGKDASANNLAVAGALQWNRNDLKVQVSGYYGGTVGLSAREADSLRLTSGIFGTPVALGEASVQYVKKGFQTKILGTVIAIPDASDINLAYANNTPENIYGVYAEVGYNIFYSMKKARTDAFILFVRYEKLDLNAAIPSNGIIDGTLDQQHVIAGFSYLPIKNVVVKADVRLLHTEQENPDLVINPSPVAPPYKQNNTFLNLGVGYSF